jgi:menaquinone-9 beta-reductase
MPTDSMKDDVYSSAWDCVVVGAGPAGAVAALCLARAGRSVLLLDKHAFPREKVCGDGLIADSINCLDRLGLLDAVSSAGRMLTAASAFSPSGFEIEVPGSYLTIKRIQFDDMLVRRAIAHGTSLARLAVHSVEPTTDGAAHVWIRGDERPITCRVAVLATGAEISLAQNLGMVTRPAPDAIAARCYVRSAHPLSKLIVSYDRAIVPGYGWIFPMADGEFNVGVGIFYRHVSTTKVDLRRLFSDFVSRVPVARDIMAGADSVTPLRGARLRCGLTGTHPHANGPVIAIGETIGTTFPFTGEGIGKAMETGELGAAAVDAFLSGDAEALGRFPDRVATLRPRYVGYNIAERWLAKPWLNDFVARRARSSRYLREALLGIFNETADPREAFSVAGLLRSFFR